MSSVKEKTMKRKLFGEHDERGEHGGTTSEKKRRRKNVEAPKHYPLSERQQLALLMQMTSAEKSPEPASPPPSIRRTPGSSGRKDKIHRRNERGETLLHLSTIKGDLEAMKELIRQGAEVNVQDFAGWTPLHEACNHGHHEITQYLLEVGANVNSRGLEDDTPLHDAVTNAHKDLVELLLKHGANPLLANKRGERPLDIADDAEVHELLQREVMMSSDEIDSSNNEEDEEKPCELYSSQSKSKDVKSVHKRVEKARTTSTCSSSSRELFKGNNKNKKKKHKSPDSESKKKSYLYLKSVTSDSSDDSDDLPLIQQKSIINPKPAARSSVPQSNGLKQKKVGKTPTLNATPVSSKIKCNHKTNKTSKSKMKISQSKIKLSSSSSSSSSSEFSTDSEYERPKKSENVAKISTSNFTLHVKQEPIKEKYISESSKQDRQSDKKSILQSEKEKPSQHSQVRRNKSYSSEEELPLSKVKTKVQKSVDSKSKTTSSLFSSLPKSSDYHVSDSHSYLSAKNDSVNKDAFLKHRKAETDESVYDFSLSTEDFTDVSGISLKQSAKEKEASDLFDSVCLGKTSSSQSESSFSSGLKLGFESKKQDVITKPPKILQTEPNRDHTTSLKYASYSDMNLDKNSNKIGSFDPHKSSFSSSKLSEKQEKVSDIHTKLTYFAEKTSSTQQTETKPIEHKATAPKYSFSHEEAKSSPQSTFKPVIKCEKIPKEKTQATSTLDTVKKSEDVTPDVKFLGAKKETMKSDISLESSVSKETSSVLSNVKESVSEIKLGSVKKKKKHKHSKSSHEAATGENKERSRRGSLEISVPDVPSTAEKDSSKSVQDKPQNKSKSDNPKTLQPVSRKSSQEGKNDSGSAASSPLLARKKTKMSETGEPETSKSVSKTPTSVTKPLKSSSSTDKQHSGNPVSSKKEKSEKKISLLSDANSFFLSELEKSSRQREIERKLKLKRKKKLLQQKQLKAQKSVEPAKDFGSGEKKSTEHPAPFPSAVDIKVEPYFSQTYLDSAGIEKGRVVSQAYQQPQFMPVQAMPKDKTKIPGFVGPHPLMHTQHLSMQNLQEHDRLMAESFSGFPHTEAFKSPTVPGRSMSQIDENCPARTEPWQPAEKISFLPPERRHLPVQRSLSFSGASTDDNNLFPPLRNPTSLVSHPDGKLLQESLVQHPTVKTIPTTANVHNFPTVPTIPPQSFSSMPMPVFVSCAQTAPVPTATPFIKSETLSSAVSSPTDPHVIKPLEKENVPINSTAPSRTNLPASGATSVLSSVTAIPPLITVTSTITEVIASLPSSQPSTSVEAIRIPATDAANVEPAAETVINEDKPKIGDDVDGEPGSMEVGTKAVDKNEDEKDSPTDDETPENKEEKSDPEKTLEDDKEMEEKLALQKYVQDRLSKLDVVIEEPKPRRLPVFIPMEKLKSVPKKDPVLDHLNVYEEWAVIQKQINDRRKKYAAAVIPQAPQCYWEYMTFTGGYLLSGSRESWLSVPVLAPPPSLSEEMQALFVEHEKERVKLRLQHATQREKLIVACEQEIMRVHSRAARTHQNQQIPLSACSVLLDREVYNVERRNKKGDGDNGTNRTAAIRDRFNARMFLSWLQDVDDKYEKMKNALLSRQRHEAQALHAVQRTEWLLKLQEAECQGQQRWSTSKPEDVTELYVPLVNISDDFHLLPG